MIINNQAEIIERASELTAELMIYIGKYFLNFKSEHDDDPAGYIYMSIHVLAMINARMGMTIEEYGKIYGIDKLDSTSIQKWIRVATMEYIQLLNEKKPSIN